MRRQLRKEKKYGEVTEQNRNCLKYKGKGRKRYVLNTDKRPSKTNKQTYNKKLMFVVDDDEW